MELLLPPWEDLPERYRNTDKTEATEIVIIDSQMNYRGKLDTYPELIFFLHLTRDYGIIVCVNDLWAISSAGRASALQAECQQFDPVIAHHNEKTSRASCREVFFLALSLPPYLSFNLLHPRSRSFARRFAPSNDVRCGTSSILLSPTKRKHHVIRSVMLFSCPFPPTLFII